MLFSVPTVIILLLVLALWVRFSPSSVRARRVLVGVAIFYSVAAIFEVPATIVRLFVRPYGRFQGNQSSHPTAIVVLGAGDETVWGWDDHLPLLNAPSAARVLEAM